MNEIPMTIVHILKTISSSTLPPFREYLSLPSNLLWLSKNYTLKLFGPLYPTFDSASKKCLFLSQSIKSSNETWTAVLIEHFVAEYVSDELFVCLVYNSSITLRSWLVILFASIQRSGFIYNSDCMRCTPSSSAPSFASLRAGEHAYMLETCDVIRTTSVTLIVMDTSHGNSKMLYTLP